MPGVMAMIIVSLTARFQTSAVVPEERHEQQTEHVKRSDERRQQAERPDYLARTLGIGAPQDFVFTHEARKRRNTGNGNSSAEHRPEGPRNLFAEAAHLAHVLFAAEGVDHRAGTKKEQSFEER